jgi:hypothetical protein
MRYFLSLVLLLTVSCSRSVPSEVPGIYKTQTGSQILVFDSRRSYLGTGQLPPGADPLRDYGTAVQTVKNNSTNCVVLSGLTFVRLESGSAECNGLRFVSRDEAADVFTIKVSCSMLQNGKCSVNSRDPPTLEYEYGYVRGQGVDWIRFGAESDATRDVLVHRSGIRILGPQA